MKDRLFAKGTSFAAGLENANFAMSKNLRPDETQVVVFFNDGKNNSGSKCDIEKQVRLLGKWLCNPPRMYLVYNAVKVRKILGNMKTLVRTRT